MKKLLLFGITLTSITVGFCQGNVHKDFMKFFKVHKHIKTFYLLDNTPDSLKNFHWDKSTGLLVEYDSYDLKEGAHSRYFFTKGQLSFVMLINEKLSKIPSIYHFEEGKVIDQRETKVYSGNPILLYEKSEYLKLLADSKLKNNPTHSNIK